MNTAAERPYTTLMAFFQTYESVDCWCGTGFADIFDAFAIWAPEEEPEEHSPTAEGSGQFPELHDIASLLPAQRQSQLEADAFKFLGQFSDEDQRRAELETRDKGGLFSYTDFWDPEGEASKNTAEYFLKLIIAHARSWDPSIWEPLKESHAEAMKDPYAAQNTTRKRT